MFIASVGDHYGEISKFFYVEMIKVKVATIVHLHANRNCWGRMVGILGRHEKAPILVRENLVPKEMHQLSNLSGVDLAIFFANRSPTVENP